MWAPWKHTSTTLHLAKDPLPPIELDADGPQRWPGNFGKEKISCPYHDPNPGLSRQWLVAVSTHNFCECTACCFSRDDHIGFAVKRHIEETAKKLTGFHFAFFKWLINCTFQHFGLNFAPSLLVCTVYDFYENFSQIFQMFCLVVTFIAHTHFRFHQSCGIWFPLVC